MGLYIDMEMPTNCEDCPMCHSNAEYDYAYCCVSSAETSGNKIPQNCPLVPIPAHGKLIDVDVLCNKLEKAGKIKPYLESGLNLAISFALTAPTIIPANEDK